MEIVDLYTDEGLKRYATKLTGNEHDAEDLISNCIEMCLLKAEVMKEISERGKLRQYFIRMIKYQYFRLAEKNKKTAFIFGEVIEDVAEEPNLTEDLEEVRAKVNDTLNSMPFFTSGLINLYRDNSYRDIAKKTGIPYVSVSRGVIAAKKEFMKIYNGTKIVVLLPQVEAVEYHRLIVPLLKMQSKYNCELIAIKSFDKINEKDAWVKKIPAGTTHVVFNKNISNTLTPEHVFVQLKSRGIKIICDIDDYWYLPKNHGLHSLYKSINMSKCIESNIQMADVVWTTTTRLADEIKEINKNVFVVKNCLDREEDQFKLKLNTNNKFDRFLWQGGGTHQYDLELLKDSVDSVKFTIQGYNKEPWMKEWFPKAKLIRTTGLNDYAKEISNHKVSLIPLRDNKFNSMKSELKLIEAGHFGRAVICSNVMPYKQHLKHRKNCLKSNNRDWAKWINKIKGDHSLQMDLGSSLNEYVRENYKLETENKLRFDTL